MYVNPKDAARVQARKRSAYGYVSPEIRKMREQQERDRRNVEAMRLVAGK